MKKTLLISFCFTFFFALTAKAQFYAGGSLAIFEGDGYTVGHISPEVGYNLNAKWALGGIFTWDYYEVVGNFFSFTPYGRFTFYRKNALSLFADGGMDFVWSDSKMYYGIGITPGILFKANDHFSFFGKAGFLGYRDTPLSSVIKGISLSSNGLDIGFYYNF